MQTLKLVSSVWFLAVKPNLLFTESERTYILVDKTSLFYYYFFISLLIQFSSRPQHFHLSVLKNPEQPFQKKTKQNNTYPNTTQLSHEALCRVQDVLSCESWPLYSTAAQSFSSEI